MVKNRNKILLYSIISLLVIIAIVIIIFLVNRNSQKSETNKSKDKKEPSENTDQVVSTGNVVCANNQYYDYNTNQCKNKIAAGSSCKNGVSCESGVCVLGSDGSGTCGGNGLSKNCIEIDPTDNNKCKTCYNLTLNTDKQCCPLNCLDCDRYGNCKDGKCESGYYLDNNECKLGESRSDLNDEVKKYCNKFPDKWYNNQKCQPRITTCEYGKYLKVNPNLGEDNTCVENTAEESKCSDDEVQYKSIYSNSVECINIVDKLKSSYNIITNKSEEDIIKAYKEYIDSDSMMTEKKWEAIYFIYRYLWMTQNKFPSQQNVPNEVKWFSDIFPDSYPNDVATHPPTQWDSSNDESKNDEGKSDDDDALTVQQRDAIKTTVRNMTGAPLKTLLKRLTEEWSSPFVMTGEITTAKYNASKQLCTQIFKNLGYTDVTR